MDGQFFAASLVSLQGADLRMVYALLTKTNIGHLLSSKTKDFFSKENQDHFMKHLEEEVKKLDQRDDESLQLDLFLELSKLLKLQGSKLIHQQEIEAQCTTLVKEVYTQFQKQDKHFRTYTESTSETIMLRQMIHYQMRRIFEDLDKSFKDFSIEDQTKFAGEINEYIQSLPEGKQDIIKEKLGLNVLSTEMIRKTLEKTGTSIVFAIIVEVSGFTFYTTVTSLVSTFAGLLGLTLPFGVYTGLTSTIAVLANPIFIIPLLVGGGMILVNHQNKTLKRKLLPIIVMQIALPYISYGEANVQFELFIHEWEKRYRQYSNLQLELDEIEKKIIGIDNQLLRLEAKIKEINSQIRDELSKMKMGKLSIKSGLKSTNLYTLDISPSFKTHLFQYQKVYTHFKQMKESNDHVPVKTGLFHRIGNTIRNISTSLDIMEEERKLDSVLDRMVDDVVNSKSSFQQIVCEHIRLYEKNLTLLKEDKQKIEKEIEIQESLIKKLNQQHQSLTGTKKQYEKETYGIDIIHT